MSSLLLAFGASCARGPAVVADAPGLDVEIDFLGTDTAPPDTPETGDSDGRPDTGDTGAPQAVVGRRGTFGTPVDGRYPGERRSRSQIAVGDLDGDGRDEIAYPVDDAAEPFRLVAFDAYTGASTTWTFTGTSPGYKAEIVGGQLLLRGEQAEMFVFNDLPKSSPVDLASAPTVLEGDLSAVMGLGDMDGDGAPDVALVVEDDLLIFRGPLPAGVLTADNAWARITGLPAASRLLTGDLDGDGNRDLIDPWSTEATFGPLPAGPSDWSELEPVWVALEWPFDGGEVGEVGDLDGDGRDELLLVTSHTTLVSAHFDDRGEAPEVNLVLDCAKGAIAHMVTSVAGPIDPDGDGLPGLALALSWGAVAIWNDLPETGQSCTEPDMWWQDEEGRFQADELIPVRLGGAGTDLLVGDDADDMGPWLVLGAGPDGADVDRDGFDAPEDCDDADSNVHPYATERANGIDDDCDGETDEAAGATTALPPPNVTGGLGNELGVDVAGWDDDGDGEDSIVAAGVSEDGATFWVIPQGADLPGATARRWAGSRNLVLAGVGDVDENGASDLAVVASDGTAWLLTRPLTGESSLQSDADARALIEPEGAPPTDSPATVAGVGDVDGDGLADVLVGGDSSEYGDYASSVAFLYTDGAAAGPLVPAGSYWCPDGLVAGVRRGGEVGDVDGDGRDDLAFTTGKEVLIFTGVQSGDWSWDDAPIVLDAGAWMVAGADLDGDGAAEVFVSEWGSLAEVHRFAGPIAPGTWSDTVAAGSVSTYEPGDFATDMALLPGTDGTLLAVSAALSDGAGQDAGRVWVFDAGWSGALTTDSAYAGWDGAAGSLAGTAIAPLRIGGAYWLAVGAPGTIGGSARDGAVGLLEVP